jgi:acyl-CoA hydrolase
MSWKNEYADKLVSVDEAAGKIESGDKCWFGPCSSSPVQLMEAIGNRFDELKDVDLVTGMALYPYNFFQDSKYIGHLNFHTIFYGAYARSFFKNGNINVNSVHLSELDKAMDNYEIDTLLADVSLPDEQGYMYYGPMGVAMNGIMADRSKKIIVQVNKNQPKVSGYKHRIHVSDVDWICEYDHDLPILPQPEVSEVETKIAAILVPLIPDGACLQVGLGGLANAVGYGLGDKKNLSVHTEMFTDSMVYLAKKGVISGKMVSAFGLGSKELYEFVGEGKIELQPIPIVNKPAEIGKHDNFVSINACVMADLTGQVCSETLGHYQYSSTGGQLDYVKGAALSKGGQSFLCLPSTIENKDGSIKSTITLNLPDGEVITTPRSEVMYVVTEYGIADLQNRPIRERVEQMISIAHPDFRDELREQAKKANLIR